MEHQDTRKPVFIKRAEGMSFEEFTKYCIEQFRAAGLLSEKESDHMKKPDENKRI